MHIAFQLELAHSCTGARAGAIFRRALAPTLSSNPRNRILTLIFIFLVRVPAVVVLGLWFVLQFLQRGLALWARRSTVESRWWAHHRRDSCLAYSSHWQPSAGKVLL